MTLLKKFVGLSLALAISVSSLAMQISAANSSLVTAGGWYEAAYAEWNNESNEAQATVEYKRVEDSQYTTVDSELVRIAENGNGRVDIVGLEAGNYNIKITTGDNEVIETVVKVTAHDRSGYAYFNNSSVGAYNADGTLKSNADVIYVTNDNKNSVQYGGYTGIGNILSHSDKLSNPLAVRVIGKVDTQTRDADGTKTTDAANGIVSINGLTDRELSGDSYFNMLSLREAQNITIEGIGDNATIEKWGMSFGSGSKSCEVRNLTFQLYPEDACSIEGNSTISDTEYFWIHNNTFNKGDNKYDLTSEKDKGEGDGTLDIKRAQYITASYNQFNQCHKTSLNGGGDSQVQYHITYQHNFFNGSSQRMPLARQADVHSYNNYYLNADTTCIDARASACVLSEGNYFEGSNNVYRIRTSSSYGDPVIKAVGDILDNSNYEGSVYVFRDLGRSEQYNVSGNKNIYKNFDTNSSVFYYSNGQSDVMYLTDAQRAKEDALNYTGVMVTGGDVLNITNVPDYGTSESTTEATTVTTSESTTEATTVTTSESTTEATTVTTSESTTEATTVTTSESTTEATTITTSESTTEATTEIPTQGPIQKVVYGDANGNGSLEINDISQLLSFVLTGDKTVGMNLLSDDKILEKFDVNRDGDINSADVANLLQKVLNKGFELECEK